jgi:hypothetical protein
MSRASPRWRAWAVGVLATVGMFCLSAAPAQAQTQFGMSFSDLNNETSVPLGNTMASAQFTLTGSKLNIRLQNLSPTGYTISSLGFNLNPNLNLSNARLLRGVDETTQTSLRLDRNALLDDVNRSIFGDFEWMLGFGGWGLSAYETASVDIDVGAPVPGSIVSELNSKGWRGILHFQRIENIPGVNSTWSGSGPGPQTEAPPPSAVPEGNSGPMIAMGLLPIGAAILLRKRAARA